MSDAPESGAFESPTWQEISVSSSNQRPRRRGLIGYAFSDISRFGQISRVLIRHGFGRAAKRVGIATREDADGVTAEDVANDPAGTARRFREVIEELGATFVKLGQVLSTRPDLLPPVYIDELSKLQDQSTSLSFDVVSGQIEEAFGRSLAEVFKRVERVPLATGSIAQTHLAELYDGQEVVIKVQRPGLDDIIRSDIDLLRLLAMVLEATIEEMGLYAPTSIVDHFDRALREELDFHVEAQHLELFADLVKDMPRLWVPKVYKEFSSKTVLVMERIPGVKVTSLEPGTQRAHLIATELLDLAYHMLFEFGVFHGDPHPGNLLVTEDDRIGLIDFGLIGRLSLKQRDTLVTMVISVVSGDIDGIARAVLQLGRPMARVPLREMREDIRAIRDRHLKNNLADVNMSHFVMELLEAGQRYRIAVPADYTVLVKASVSLEGIIRYLYPTLNIPEALGPYSKKLLLQRYSPQRLSQGVLTAALSASGMIHELPMQFSQLLMDMEYDGLRVRVESEALAEMRVVLNRLGTKVALGLVACGLIVGFFVATASGASSALVITTAVLAIGLVVNLLMLHALDGRPRKVRITPLMRLLRRARGD